MARFPSGITGDLPGEDIEDPQARAAQIALEAGLRPIAETAPCMNPECGGPVDYVGTGPAVRFCSRTCRSRVVELRRRVVQQIALIERTLAEAKGRRDVPRNLLEERVRLLRWWMLRLGAEAVDEGL